MAVIRPYVAEYEPAVAEFNDRMKAGGSAFSFRTSAPASSETAWSAFVAVDIAKESGRATVRGGYIGVRHLFSLCGEDVDVHYLKLPLSESTVDPKYNAVGLQLLVDVQRRYPLSFTLGMGGRQSALAKILESLGWKLLDVRFFFRVARPSRFLRQISFLRTTRERKLALDLLAASGLGLGILPVHAWLGRRTSRPRDVRMVEVDDWGDGEFVDRIWEMGRSQIAFAARRDAARLRELYPSTDRRFLRLRVDRAGEAIGWALLLDTQLAGHKHFGNMRLGSLVDGFTLPGEERHVVRAATRFLHRRGVDLLVSNQSASAWCEAMLASGWIEGPSNYALALSKELAARLDGNVALHVTRGDGDGPIHL
jgi:hypothetical protein